MGPTSPFLGEAISLTEIVLRKQIECFLCVWLFARCCGWFCEFINCRKKHFNSFGGCFTYRVKRGSDCWSSYTASDSKRGSVVEQLCGWSQQQPFCEGKQNGRQLKCDTSGQNAYKPLNDQVEQLEKAINMACPRTTKSAGKECRAMKEYVERLCEAQQKTDRQRTLARR